METELVKELKRLREIYKNEEFWDDEIRNAQVTNALTELIEQRVGSILKFMMESYHYASMPNVDEVIKVVDDPKLLDKYVQGRLEDVECFLKDGVFW